MAGIPESAVAAIHKLLLKGKTVGQIIKNHNVIHLNLSDTHIYNYIHNCSVVSTSQLGRKPRWVLQYLQTNGQHDNAASPRGPAPSQPHAAPASSVQRPSSPSQLQAHQSLSQPQVVRGAPRSSRAAAAVMLPNTPSPERTHAENDNPIVSAMANIAAAVSPAPLISAHPGIAATVSSTRLPPVTTTEEGFVGLQVCF